MAQGYIHQSRVNSASCRTGHQPANLINMHCVYACSNSSRIKAFRHIVFLIFCLWLAKDSRVTQCVYSDFFINSDEFKLIFGCDTGFEDYTFNGFSEQDLIMGDTSSSRKKHSKTKKTPTTTPSVRANVEVTPQIKAVTSCSTHKIDQQETDG